MKLKIKQDQFHQAPQAVDESASTQRRRLLVVDDERMLLELLQQLLGQYYDVRVAESGAEALEIMDNGFLPEVILADQRMPGMSGAEFLAQSASLSPKAVHMVLTGYTDVADIVESINIGHVYLLLTKPWQDKHLLQSLKAAFGQHDLISQNRELLQALDDLEQANVSLQRMNAEKSEFMAMMAHGLKNPLTGIHLSAELIRRYLTKEPTNPTVVERVLHSARQIELLVKRMVDDVENYLNADAIDQGTFTYTIKPFDLAAMCRASVQDYQLQAQAKTIRLQAIIPEHAVIVRADETATKEAVENLLSNALKYSPSGKTVTLAVASAVAKTMEKTGTVARVEIRDEGPGISNDDMAKMFKKYTRLSAKPTGGEHSSGLGLSIVKKMVDKMGGRVWCESELGKGATFFLELPLIEEHSN